MIMSVRSEPQHICANVTKEDIMSKSKSVTSTHTSTATLNEWLIARINKGHYSKKGDPVAAILKDALTVGIKDLTFLSNLI